jgi:hypothetical protein
LDFGTPLYKKFFLAFRECGNGIVFYKFYEMGCLDLLAGIYHKLKDLEINKEQNKEVKYIPV